MQYFSFLGMGDIKKGYDEALYYFGYEHSNENYATRFVQTAIVEKYLDEINDIYIFCTEQSYAKHGISLEKEMCKKLNKKIHYLFIDYDINSEDIIKQMNRYINDDFIIDITHSYRSIPVSVLLITRYLEVSKNKKLLHLYYGKYDQDTNEGDIIDLINLYDDSKIVNDLESFNKHLKVASTNLTSYKDDKIICLFNAFKKFNQMIELCEFDECIKCVNNICICSNEILKNENEYMLLVPYINAILNKLKDIKLENKYELKKIKFIRLLLNHGLYQIAITFSDQLFREELIHKFYFPNDNKFNQKLLINLSRSYRKNINVYNLSQDLMARLNIRNNKYINTNFDDIYNSECHASRSIVILDKHQITHFYDKVRNKINHGEKIDLNLDEVNKVISDFLLCIEKFIMED